MIGELGNVSGSLFELFQKDNSDALCALLKEIGEERWESAVGTDVKIGCKIWIVTWWF